MIRGYNTQFYMYRPRTEATKNRSFNSSKSQVSANLENDLEGSKKLEQNRIFTEIGDHQIQNSLHNLRKYQNGPQEELPKISSIPIVAELIVVKNNQNNDKEENVPTEIKDPLSLSKPFQKVKAEKKINKLLEQCSTCYNIPQLGGLVRFSENCNHRFCMECINLHVRQRIQQFQEVKCLTESCLAVLEENSQFIQKLPLQLREKYYKIRIAHTINRNLNARRCTKEDCYGYFLITQRSCVCIVCGQQHCSECYMSRKDCKCNNTEEVAENLKEDNKYQRCKCGYVVQKIQGCPHMTCKCKRQFCYNCGQSWNSGHVCPPKPPPKPSKRTPLFSPQCIEAIINIFRWLLKIILFIAYFAGLIALDILVFIFFLIGSLVIALLKAFFYTWIVIGLRFMQQFQAYTFSIQVLILVALATLFPLFIIGLCVEFRIAFILRLRQSCCESDRLFFFAKKMIFF